MEANIHFPDPSKVREELIQKYPAKVAKNGPNRSLSMTRKSFLKYRPTCVPFRESSRSVAALTPDVKAWCSALPVIL